jgi:hypothetical protein
VTTEPSNRARFAARTPDLRPRIFWALQAAITLGYMAFCLLASRRKPLWCDEIFTMLVDRLGGPAEVWRHVRAGMDNHPPLGYVLGNLSIRLFGFSELALRLPSMVAFWVAMLATYRFTARRGGEVAGLSAMILLLSSAALPFAVEARGYALVVCFASLALLAWQSAGEADRRVWSLLGLSASLAAAMWTHYYAVLLFVPLGVGELVKVWQRRKIDWPLALSLGAGALTFVPLYLLFVRGPAAGFVAHFWAAVGTPLQILDAFRLLFQSMSLPLIGLGVIGLLAARDRRAGPAVDEPRPPIHEVVAVLACFFLPALMWVMARLVTNAFVFRYVLFAVVGGSAAMALGIRRLGAGDPIWRRRLAVALLAWLPVALMMHYRALETHAPVRKLVDVARSTAESLDVDIVFDSNFDYLQYVHYAGEGAGARMFHLMDAEAQLRYNDDDTMAQVFAKLQQFVDLHVETREAFLSTHRRFAVISSVRFTDGWILPMLVADERATIALVGEEKPITIYLVTYAPGP